MFDYFIICFNIFYDGKATTFHILKFNLNIFNSPKPHVFKDYLFLVPVFKDGFCC